MLLLGHLDTVWPLGTLARWRCDEEIGSPGSRPLIAQALHGALAALVFEPSADGAVKTARKGVSQYTMRIADRAAHAGLEPERGINAAIEAASQVLAIADLADPAAGTTVTPTVLSAPPAWACRRCAACRSAAGPTVTSPPRRGVDTLDGLGAAGGNAHAEGEWASVSAMPQRAALAGLIRLILRRGASG